MIHKKSFLMKHFEEKIRKKNFNNNNHALQNSEFLIFLK